MLPYYLAVALGDEILMTISLNVKAHLFSVSLCITTTAACTHSHINADGNSSAITRTDSVSTLLYPVENASNDIKTFDDIFKRMHRHYRSDDSFSIPGVTRHVNAYTVSSADLLAAMGIPHNSIDTQLCKYKYCRTYLGYNLKEGFKLFIVPVDGANLHDGKREPGSDIMLKSDFTPADPADHNYRNQYVLDLNAPCPSICDGKSPLVQQLF